MQNLVETIYNTIINLKSGKEYKNPLEGKNEDENK